MRVCGLAVLACATLMLSAGGAGAAAFEWEGAFAAGGIPGEIAADGAGRVYVPLRNQGRVALYDNARGGNHLLRTFGEGVLVDPYAVAIDDREDVYVADRGLHAVVVFDALVNNSGSYKVNGSQGAALTQFDEPRGIAVDSLTRAYVVEAGNLRAQVLEVASTELRALFAFGLLESAGMTNPDGVALDSLGRYYVSDNSGSGIVALFDPRGALLGGLVGSGAGAGQVSSPRGLETDQVNRLLVADSGNDRISLFNAVDAGTGHLGSFGSTGAGTGQFDGPSSISLAPGAMLYVGDEINNRIVRLRFDDADHDGAVDAVDVCPGVADPHQYDHDGDRAGDECDLDDDGDGLPDSLDPCPITLPVNDLNGDGCADPVSAVTSPARASKFRSSGPASIGGTAKADVLGVRSVQVAVARRSARGCSWLSSDKGRLRRGACDRPRYFKARGDSRWRAALRGAKLPPGRYEVYTRARQKRSGVVERGRLLKTTFRILR